MADISVTAASVAMHATAPSTAQVTYGATITQGQVLYKDATDSNHYKLADADLSAAASTVAGIALTPGDDGDKGYVATAGPIDVGGTLTVGVVYALSDTDSGGFIAPVADLATGDYVSILGVASAADQLELKIDNSGVVMP